MANKTMSDEAIVALYFARNEQALAETELKFGRYLYKVAYNILFHAEDSEESVNDTYMDAWRAIPPAKPSVLGSFLAKITRRIAIDRVRASHAQKREGSQYDLSLEEWRETFSEEQGHSGEALESVEAKELGAYINEFLSEVKAENRRLFVRRYFHMDSVKEVAEAFGLTESNVKTTLFRMRKDLAVYLQERGYTV